MLELYRANPDFSLLTPVSGNPTLPLRRLTVGTGLVHMALIPVAARKVITAADQRFLTQLKQRRTLTDSADATYAEVRKEIVAWMLPNPSVGETFPTRDLVLKLFDTSDAELRDVASEEGITVGELTTDLSRRAFERLIGAIINLAYRQSNEGHVSVVITENGRFNKEFAVELFRVFPIDPYDSRSLFHELYDSLRRFVQSRQVRGPWGDLVVDGLDLRIVLP